MAVRNLIRDWRLRKKLTLEQLGDMAGMSAGNLSRLERGEILYTQATLENLATALGCEPAELLGAEVAPRQKVLLDVFGLMSTEDQERLIRLAVALAEFTASRDGSPPPPAEDEA